MSKLDARLEAVRQLYDLRQDDFWELPQRKGTWIIKHSALEVVAVKAHIQFDAPQIIEANTEKGIAVMAVRGTVANEPNRTTWATGEAAPNNNKNAYPWAMAEKRSRDRVVLKLIGIEAYSEDEADDFKRNGPSGHAEARGEPFEVVEDSVAKKVFTLLQVDLRAAATMDQLDGAWKRWLPVTVHWSESMQQNCEDVRLQMANYLRENDGDARKVNRDMIEAELRASMSMEDLTAKRDKFRHAFMRLGKDDQLHLSRVTKEMEGVIAAMREGADLAKAEKAARLANTP